MEREIANSQWMDAKGHFWAFRHGLGRPDVAAQLLEEVLWGEESQCPKCGLTNRSVLLSDPNLIGPREWKCAGCAESFTVRDGTWMQDEPATLDLVVFGVASVGLEGSEFAVNALVEQAGLSEEDANGLVQRIEEQVFTENSHPKSVASSGMATDSGAPSRDKRGKRLLPLITGILGAAMVWGWAYVRPDVLSPNHATHAAGIAIPIPLSESADPAILMDKWEYFVNGTPVKTKIVTKRGDYSSAADWRAAHRRTVLHLKAKYPPTQ